MRPTTTDRSQRSRILGLLVAARDAEVGLPEILDLHISQFGSRIKELRDLGFVIVNRQEFQAGQKLSWYRLLSGPALPSPAPQPKPELPEQSDLFDLSPRRYPD